MITEGMSPDQREEVDNILDGSYRQTYRSRAVEIAQIAGGEVIEG